MCKGKPGGVPRLLDEICGEVDRIRGEVELMGLWLFPTNIVVKLGVVYGPLSSSDANTLSHAPSSELV